MNKARRILKFLEEFDKILHDLVNLSSGTIATIFGVRDYTEIDKIQSDLVDFYSRNKDKKNWKNWMDVVKDYCKDKGLKFDDKIGKVIK